MRYEHTTTSTDIAWERGYMRETPSIVVPEGDGWKCVGSCSVESSSASYIVWTWEREKP